MFIPGESMHHQTAWQWAGCIQYGFMYDVMAGQREYNKRQRELLNSYKDVEKFLQDVESSQNGGNGGPRRDDEQSGERHEGLAISLSNIANVFLLVIKVNSQGKDTILFPPKLIKSLTCVNCSIELKQSL